MRRLIFIFSILCCNSSSFSQYLRSYEDNDLVIEHDAFAQNPFTLDIGMMNSDDIKAVLPSYFNKSVQTIPQGEICNDQINVKFTSPDQKSELEFFDCSYELLNKIILFENAIPLKYNIKIGDNLQQVIQKFSINIPIKLGIINTIYLHDAQQANHVELHFKNTILISIAYHPIVE